MQPSAQTTTKENRKPTVRSLVLSPLNILVTAALLGSFAIYVAQNYIVSKYMENEAKEKCTAISQFLDSRMSRIEKSALQMSVDYTELFAASEEDDIETIEYENGWTVDMAGLQGYVYTDTLSNLLCSSFKALDAAETRRIADAAKRKNNVLRGFGTFVNNAVCEYATTIVRNDDKNPIGIVTHIGFISSDDSTLHTLAQQTGVELYIFDGNKCVAGSANKTNLGFMTPPLVEETEFSPTPKEVYAGKTEFEGDNCYGAIIPLESYNKQLVGHIFIKLNDDLARSIHNSLIVFILVLAGTLAIIYTILSVRVRKKLLKPISRLSKEVGLISSGDLTVKVKKFDTCKELARLSNDVSDMQEKIRQVIKPIAETSNNLVSTIHQMTQYGSQLSESANSQAAALEEISSSMEQMGAGIRQNADNAVTTNKMTQEANAMVSRLGKNSRTNYEAISKIAGSIRNINSLVSQTNILSLNASVEAARAGEHGKGFAVVAKQVGILAERTKGTASEITDTATSSIKQSEEANTVAQELVPMINNVAALIKEISVASLEQDTGVSQVNSAIMSLNRVAQQNAANAEEIAACANDLEDAITNLRKAVNNFMVD